MRLPQVIRGIKGLPPEFTHVKPNVREHLSTAFSVNISVVNSVVRTYSGLNIGIIYGAAD